MNAKICKRISRKSEVILFEWLKTIVPESEHDKVNINNFKQYLPDTNYFNARGHLWLSFYSPKWVRKSIKRLVCLGRGIDNITMSDLESYTKDRGVRH